MQIKARFFDELCGDAIYIRKAVFMQEQGFHNEFDETDKISTHVVLYNTDGKPVATGRLFPDSDKPNSYIIGRVAVLKEFRRNSLGSEVIKALESKAAEKNADSISLSAQCRVQKFYESLGYHATDDLHDDEGCPHVTMVKKL